MIGAQKILRIRLIPTVWDGSPGSLQIDSLFIHSAGYYTCGDRRYLLGWTDSTIAPPLETSDFI